ncbi:MAG: endonuclease/exonuclease/phosphatase family protein [Alterinioella nitratireducens]|uniref:endonuclease/exonuclease/phosphatase family protein n=1 Tax=Alterinioella nitratireducens TaxID=2735915 RepID=UPI004059790A|tara:strand:+ start:384 stop:1103 length:720 start_codon:yes stop_codon:yes gene_type:complete
MSYPAPPAPDHLRVLSYNIHKCVGLDRRRDPHRVAQVIRGIGPSIAVLQEADKRLGPRPAALPPQVVVEECGMLAAPVATTRISLGWHGNAILMTPGWHMEALHRLPLPGLEPRGAVIADLSGPQDLRVVATHLGLRRRDRQHQMTLIMAELAHLPRRPTILLADCNEWSATEGFAPLDPFFTLHNSGRSFPARRPMAALDRLATGPGIEVVQQGVCRTGIAGRASDHLPIWADLSLAG